MGKLFLTGDTHGGIDITKLNTRHFNPAGLTEKDVVVIMGDAGFVWNDGATDKFWQNFLDNKPWTTFCVLGNHENYDLIEKLPTVEKFGAPVYKVSEKVFYAKTGEIYTICGKKCLVVNGADSHDIFVDGKRYRYPHISWWEQERITHDDVIKALSTLDKHDYKVDYIFTHTGGSETCRILGFAPYPSDRALDLILNSTDYDKHFCGHYHVDKLCDKTRVLYDDVICVAEDCDE